MLLRVLQASKRLVDIITNCYTGHYTYYTQTSYGALPHNTDSFDVSMSQHSDSISRPSFSPLTSLGTPTASESNLTACTPLDEVDTHTGNYSLYACNKVMTTAFSYWQMKVSIVQCHPVITSFHHMRSVHVVHTCWISCWLGTTLTLQSMLGI